MTRETIDEVRRALAANRETVLTAPPGSGKTTEVAPALLDEPWLKGRKIVMLEPRRLAARNCADYIARSKFGESVGATVGYQVRLERKTSRATRLEILTEGLLAQRITNDPELADTALVIFDEFHERSLACDLAFALALDVRRALRPDLRILVMSATLDTRELMAHLDDPALVSAEGRMFPVETHYLGDVSVAAAATKALSETNGDILAFLPGEGEIHRTAQTLRTLLDNRNIAAQVLELYGALPKEEQDRIFLPSDRRKVILSTSIAETSLTIPGITCVIDSGLMRVSRFTPSTGMSGLVTLPLSLDRAEQRRGRAGRVAPGTCYRLWREQDEAARARKTTPEILDADLAPLVLASVSFGALERDSLPWLTLPADAPWRQARALLIRLGALDHSGRLTEKGKAMSRLAIHPRLANMLIESAFSDSAALLAAIIEEKPKTRETDIRRILDLVHETPNLPSSRRILQLANQFKHRPSAPNSIENRKSKITIGKSINRKIEKSLSALLSLAYPERVAKNRGNGTFQMVSGRGAMLEREDPLAKSPFIVCCALDDRPGDAKVFLASPITKDEIEELFSAAMSNEQLCEWDKREERVKCVARRKLGEMVFSESPQASAGDSDFNSSDAITLALVAGIRSKGVANLPCWTKFTRELRERIAFASRHIPGWPNPSDDAILSALEPRSSNLNPLLGMSKWRDLEKLDLAAVLDSIIAASGHTRRELDRIAPEKMLVPSGSNMTIHYDGDEPTVEVRLQECFGLLDTPKIALGKVPIVMTLLSPAMRPIQITKDLARFWSESYQLVRKDMRGRYPKHNWPEDPFSATASRRTIKPKNRS